ncbi:hypothetical protein WN943_025673 [Citrus x changshan-huyou]
MSGPWWGYHCRACGLKFDKRLCYRCDDCKFEMHPECLSLKPTIKYQGHQHDLLTLLEDMAYKSECRACGHDIKNTFYVRCVPGRLDFHVHCGPAAASLPPTVVHKNHNHPLSLVKDDSTLLECDDCEEEIDPNHPFYSCLKCYPYNAHVRCVITEIQFDERGIHEHFTHHHLLALLESQRNDDMDCYICMKLIIQGHTAYGCDPCGFYLHKSCFKLPKVMCHKSHDSHYLTFENSSNSGNVVCKGCDDYLKGYRYRCGSCDFELDLDCAIIHPSINWKAGSDEECKYYDKDRKEGLRHYSHYHPLKPSAVGDYVECKLCHKNIRSSSYGCESCMFYIHKLCAELPQNVQHPFHPHRCLTLGAHYKEIYRCEACYFYVNPGVYYRCDDKYCETYFHLECVSLKPNIKYEGHQHLLILVENMSYQGKCEACHSEIVGTFFVRCVQCDLNFHVQCGTVSYPSTVDHRHHHHPLTLTTPETLVKDDSILHSCGVCKGLGDPSQPSYCCVECEYYTHMRCVINEMQFNKREKVKHFSHEDHFLFLVGNKKNGGIIKCSACDKLIQTAHLAYGCDQCNYYLHKSCIELPRQIQHLFHRHPLTLQSHRDDGTKYQRCSACDKKLGGFFYQCSNCFVLDVDCALLQLGVQLEGHEYILTLFAKLRHAPECRRYLSATTGALDQNCVKCNFVVYLLRSPLPQVIECSSHHHPLTLTEKVVDDNYGTQICDICEEDRDPEVCIYYCTECDFIAEFICIIFQVAVALQKQPQDILLRRINRKTTGKSLTYENLVSSSRDEEKQLYFDWWDEKELLWEWLDEEVFRPQSPGKQVSLIKTEEYKSEVIDVGDYKTIPRLAGVLKNLIDKYGDIGASCNLPQSCCNLKMRIMLNLCATVHSMCDILIQDVDERFLDTWRKHFSIARRVGFEVDFLFDRLKIIEEAHKCFNDTDNQLHQFTSIDRRYDEMAEISRGIEKQKTKLDSLRWQTQHGISSIAFQRLRVDAEQLSKAREFGLKKAGMHSKLL